MKNKLGYIMALIGILGLSFLTLPHVYAEGLLKGIGDTITYQGRLYDLSGFPILAGNYNIQFTFCSAADCSTTVWGPVEKTTSVDDKGYFNVLLDGLNANHFNGDRWIRIEVCTVEGEDPCTTGWDLLSPDQPLTSSALAIGNIRKNVVDSTTASNISGGVLSGINTSTNDGSGLFGSGLYGVYGYSSSLVGVYGRSDKEYGVGGYFYCLGDQSGTDTSVGVMGRNDAQNVDGFGVAGHHYWNGVGIGAWSYTGNIIEAFDGDYPSGLLEFYLDQNGYGWFNGGYGTFKQINKSDPTEARALYGIQSTEVWAEDFGTGTLLNGWAEVELDPLFSKMVNLHENYHVFLTPLGECNGLFVTNKKASSFQVHELNQGRNSISFDYRIVAKSEGNEQKRMEKLTIKVNEEKELTPEEKQATVPHPGFYPRAEN